MAVELERSGILAECKVEVLGTKLSVINKAEDRDLSVSYTHLDVYKRQALNLQ